MSITNCNNSVSFRLTKKASHLSERDSRVSWISILCDFRLKFNCNLTFTDVHRLADDRRREREREKHARNDDGTRRCRNHVFCFDFITFFLLKYENRRRKRSPWPHGTMPQALITGKQRALRSYGYTGEILEVFLSQRVSSSTVTLLYAFPST